MAMHCIHGGECTGCMSCEPKPKIVGYCTHCREAVYGWEEHYDMDGEVLLHSDCLIPWANKYLVVI